MKIKPEILREMADMRAYCARFMIKPLAVAKELGVATQYVGALMRGEISVSRRQMKRVWKAIHAVKREQMEGKE